MKTLNLPPDFVRNIRQSFPQEAEAWLKNLPALLSSAAGCWELELGEPMLLSYNYVCPARRRDGTDCVLKIGVPNCELTSEINTLRLYGGQGACQLLDADVGQGMLLLERLEPGTMLVTLPDDDQATAIAADVMKLIHRPIPIKGEFLNLKGWFDVLKKVRVLFNGGTGPFPAKTFALVESLMEELFAENVPQTLLHGDFHHFNILLSGRGWLVIDPKGVSGPAEYDAGPFLTNPNTFIPQGQEAIRRTRRRIDILSERVGFDRQRLRAWAICHCVLSSFWDMDENGKGGEAAREWTEIIIRTKV
jgi:streptomycin 6-kinase